MKPEDIERARQIVKEWNEFFEKGKDLDGYAAEPQSKIIVAVQCPTPDKCRIHATGPRLSTLMYYEPIYDGYGNNLNPDANRSYEPMKCSTCGREWESQTTLDEGLA